MDNKQPFSCLSSRSEAWWRAGGNDDQFAITDIAKRMRAATVKQIGIAGTKFIASIIDFELQSALDDDTAFFALVTDAGSA